MPLKLTITSFQRLSPGQEPTKTLDRGSLTIGRAAQNDWVLQDPERILSKNHCTVDCRDGAYFLTDLSANGTFLNDSEQRIPRNQTVPLKDGDHFVLGEYEIEATLLPGAAELAEPDMEGPLTEPAIGVAGLGSDASILSQPSFADLIADHQAPLHDKPPIGSPAKGAVATEPSPDLLTPDRAFFEPPELRPESPPAPEPTPAESPPPVLPRPGSEPPIQAIPDDFMAPAPAAAQPAEALIPDDWWLAPPVVQQPSELPAPPISPAPPPVEPVQVETPPPELQIPQRPAPVLVEPSPAPSPSPAPAAATPAGLDAKTLIHAFLEGAGLPNAQPTAEQWLEIATNLGAMFRETVQGLTDILLARGDVKGEFRLDRTAIGPMENNPLKTPPGRPPLSPEEIMTLLLVRQRDAYMSPVQAVREGFKDIKDHQMAVWAGVQAALNRLLERFDPRNLETRLQQTVFDSILPASRKAKYWDLFTTEYQAIAREAEDDFNELFGDEFARAYEERLRAHR